MSEGKWISDLNAGTPLADAARRVLAVRLEVVRDYLGLALQQPDKDPEHVHQLRVGTRRAGAALRLFALCLPERTYRTAKKHLRRLRRAAGGARDWDVFLLGLTADAGKDSSRRRPGLDFLTGLAVANRMAAQDHLAAAGPDYPFAFDRLLADTLAAIDRPPAGPRTLLDLARPLLRQHLDELHAAAGADLDDYDHLHRVRICGKRLRYAMEVFADCFPPLFRERLYPEVEEMQEILGRANDSHVAAGRLAALRDKVRAVRPGDWKRYRPGVEALLRFHEQRLPQERERFLKWWDHWHKSGAEAAFVGLLKSTGTTRQRSPGPAA